MASIDDVLTAVKNIVTALNSTTTVTLQLNGTAMLSNISAATLVKSTAGRAVRVSVTTAGSTVGTVYDTTSTGSPSLPIYTIPNAVGIVNLNIPVVNGIVVVPGTSQVVTMVYS